MVAYQFASYYQDLLARYEEAADLAQEADAILGRHLGMSSDENA